MAGSGTGCQSLHREVGGFGAPEDATDVDPATPKHIRKIRPVGGEAARLHVTLGGAFHWPAGNSRLDLRVPLLCNRGPPSTGCTPSCVRRKNRRARSHEAVLPSPGTAMALELQWVCLAQRAEREAVNSQQDEIAAASQTSKAA